MFNSPQEAYIIVCLIAAISAQLIKFIGHYIKTKKTDYRMLFESGGMPSSHAALVAALTTVVFIQEGFNSVFVIALVFSMIIIRDAMGIRHQVGIHATILNKISTPEKKRLGIKKLTEPIGHTPKQVTMGVILGVGIAIILNLDHKQFLLFLINCLYLMAPVYAAAILTHLISKRDLPWNKRLNLRFKGSFILGNQPTILGIILTIITVFFVSYIQYLLNPMFISTTFINYAHWIIIAAAISLGIIIADIISSFIKKRMNLEEGPIVLPWDLMDDSIGGMTSLLMLSHLSITILLATLVFSTAFMGLISYVLHLLRLSRNDWQ